MRKLLPYIGLLGWLTVAIFSLVLYPDYFKTNCSFESSWIFCQGELTIWFKVLSFLLVSFFILSQISSGFLNSSALFTINSSAWFTINSSAFPAKSRVLAMSFACIFLAILTVPFGSSDTSYYFSAGEAATHGLNPYVDDWIFTRDFVSPKRYEPANGFSYGPIMASIFKYLYQISFGNAAVFIIFWKIFLAAVFFSNGFLLYRLLEGKEEKISRPAFFSFWLVQPLFLFEVLVNGHFDIFWLLSVLLAIWAAQKNKWWLVIPLLVIGVWIKFIPILITPVFVLWWWQEINKDNLMKRSIETFVGLVIGAIITLVSWQGFWQGFKVFNLIALQSKWAVSSVFSLIYYSLQPLFVLVLNERSHWFLTRLVQGGLVLTMIFLLWPYIKKVISVILRKNSLSPQSFVEMIFFSLMVYLSIWQKSFWPWYAVWLIPLGILAYGYSRNLLLGRLLAWLSLAPLVFYPVWLLNWLTRRTDACGELWFQYVFVLLVWAYPLYIFMKLRNRDFEL